MKKFLVLILCVSMMMSFAMIGSSFAEDINLEYLCLKSEVQDVMREIIADYEKDHPGVHIELTFAVDGAVTLANRINSNNVPDIMNVYPLENSYRAYCDEGYIMDLADQPFMSNLEQSMLDLASYNGVQISVPMTLSTYGIYYNKDIYAELGLKIPTTIDELIANAEACKAAGYDAFTLPMASAQNQITERLLGALDGETYLKFQQVADGELAIRDVPSIKAYGELMLALKPLSTEDSLGLDGNGATADFVNGKAVMKFDGSWFLNTIKTAAPEMNVGYFGIPAAEGKVIVPVNCDTAFAVSATSPHQDVALDFLAYMTQTEVATKYYTVDGNINMVKGVVYDKAELMDLYNTVMAGDMSITQINRWGNNGTLVRADLAAAIQALILDEDMDAYYDACEAAILDSF